MKITYDKSSDAAYIYLLDEVDIGRGWVKKTHTCDQVRVGGAINLDFDKEGRLGGIEILDARKKLPPGILNRAQLLN